jgi:hypothetical protein
MKKQLFILIIIAVGNFYFLSNSQAFESPIFQELAKIRKISIAVHANKVKLSTKTKSLHDHVASDLNGLIDTIIDEIQLGNEEAHEEDFNTLNDSLRELQQSFQYDLKQPSDNVHPWAYSFVGPALTYILIIEGIPFILRQIESWQNEKREIKLRRISHLETYKWKFIY